MTKHDLIVIDAGLAGVSVVSQLRRPALGRRDRRCSPYGETCALRGCELKKIGSDVGRSHRCSLLGCFASGSSSGADWTSSLDELHIIERASWSDGCARRSVV